MNWKAIWGVLGGIIFIISVDETFYQLINWDNDYRELIKNFAFAVVGLSGFMNWRKNNRDGELLTDEEEKQLYQEWQDKKEDEDSTS